MPHGWPNGIFATSALTGWLKSSKTRRFAGPSFVCGYDLGGVLRGVESNHRPAGYEPTELPLLYRAKRR